MAENKFLTRAYLLTQLKNMKDVLDDEYASKDDIQNIYKYKGSVETADDLPTTGQEAGDTYNIESTGVNVAWVEGDPTAEPPTEGFWDSLGGSFSVVVETTDIDFGTNPWS